MKFDILTSTRKALGMTQQDLAKASGMSQANISGYETGLHSPTLDTIKRLADAMNMDVCIWFREKKDEADD